MRPLLDLAQRIALAWYLGDLQDQLLFEDEIDWDLFNRIEWLRCKLLGLKV